MQVFYHLVYEYQKGLRDLCLFTCSHLFQEKIEKSLKTQKIEYMIHPIKNTTTETTTDKSIDDKINVFFGMPACLEIIKQFSNEDLNKLTHEEDFILGMMLGYAKPQQYERFLNRKCLCA